MEPDTSGQDGRVDEIVGESGEAGEGCLSLIATGVATLGLVILTAVPAQAAPAPRRPEVKQISMTPTKRVVPDLTGLSSLQARMRLTALGLVGYEWMNKEATVWTVAYQEPAPGTAVSVGDRVEYWIGN